jgi:hypothetical protein
MEATLIVQPNLAVNWTASTLRVPAASYLERWATE